MKKLIAIFSVIFPLVAQLPGFTEGVFWVIKSGDEAKRSHSLPVNPAFPVKILKGYVLENVKKIKK